MEILSVSWKVLCQLSPWLLLGMVFSGVLHVFLPVGYVRRSFHGIWGVVKAVLFGIPLPLCSCGVVPAGIGLKNQGASSGASIGFLISTPQTGVDSILVSASFFGWPFALFKMATAGITGVIGGWMTGLVEANGSLQDSGIAERAELESAVSIFSQTDPAERATLLSRLMAVWVHGVEIMRSIWAWLVIGVLISALIETYVPSEWFQVVGQWGLLPAMLIVLFLSIPLYVCATASVPIAAALVTGGMPPAAALVFLLAGPATNVTTIGAIWTRFGGKILVVYLSTIVFGSMLFAAVFDWLLTAEVVSSASHQHDHQNVVSIASATILVFMIGRFAFLDCKRWARRWRGVDSVAPRTQIGIEGMTCGGCVSRIEGALQAIEGVESVEVELKSGMASIIGDVDRNRLEGRIRELGFIVVDAEVSLVREE